MKLGIFTTSFLPYHSRLGVSNAAFFTAKKLIENHGCDVHVFSSRMEGCEDTEELDNLHIHRFPYISRHKITPKMLELFRKERFDIIHSYHYGYFPAFAGLILSKMTHRPHLFTTAYHPPIYTSLRTMLLRTYDILEGFWSLKYSDIVLPFNNDEKRHLEKYVKGNYKVVPCPINSDVFFPKRKENEKITIAYVGPMLPWKGASIAFEIFQQIEKERRDVSFIFIGMGFLEDEIKNKASKRFTFMKDVSPAELAKIYNSIDILVSPTYYESFGCVLAEAGMCGTPIVSTKVGGVPETVGNGGLLVNYGDWNKMKENIEMLIDDKILRKKLGRNAVIHTKQFSSGIVAENVFKLYKGLL